MVVDEWCHHGFICDGRGICIVPLLAYILVVWHPRYMWQIGSSAVVVVSALRTATRAATTGSSVVASALSVDSGLLSKARCGIWQWNLVWWSWRP